MTILVWVVAALLGQQPVSSTTRSLDFEYFKTNVQPIFLARRDGHARCYSCHSQGTTMRLQALLPGSTMWSE